MMSADQRMQRYQYEIGDLVLVCSSEVPGFGMPMDATVIAKAGVQSVLVEYRWRNWLGIRRTKRCWIFDECIFGKVDSGAADTELAELKRMAGM